MQRSAVVGLAICCALLPLQVGAQSGDAGRGDDAAASDGAGSDDNGGGDDASLKPSGKGCAWRVPPAVAAVAKKTRRKHAATTVARVVLSDVACDTVRVIAVRSDGQKVAVTAATEGAPSSVQAAPGTLAMVYPLSYRMFEADLGSGKVAEFGLPKLAFKFDTRPAAAVGYNRRDSLVIVAMGAGEGDNNTVLQRFTPGRRGWNALKEVSWKTDGMPEPPSLCGDNFLIRAAFTRDPVNICVLR